MVSVGVRVRPGAEARYSVSVSLVLGRGLWLELRLVLGLGLWLELGLRLRLVLMLSLG